MTTSDQLSPGSREWLLAFADDEHMIGSRHAAWIGLGPFLEEDLAFCSIAQDELGHAIRLYEFITDEVDRFALLREPAEYRSAWLTELPCDHWDQALTRHWLYDQAEQLRWGALSRSSDDGLQALVARAEREEAFHRQHAELFLSRIAAGGEEGRARIRSALEFLLPYAVAIWEPVAGESEALSDGLITTGSDSLAQQWEDSIKTSLEGWDLSTSWPQPISGQDNRHARTPEFPALLASLQEVITIDSAAIW